ncbi:AAA domain-containing protein [Reichenbachiella versicolor]|uniref:AAA domain-containing protein n=1 Tax=Reichenbachiella versicolor TaxID=1821036 RepID=UPI000D6DE312|nr:AAA domain-containing protein [Reichenbachiella versicolor]
MNQSGIQDHLKKQLILLAKEKEEDLKQYRQKMMSTSLKERRKQGVCWYPVQMIKSHFDAGERLIIKVSRPAEHTDAHLFQSGKLISFFSSTGDSDGNESVNGVVNNVTKSEMIITLNADEIPQWTHHGKLGIQLLFDENAYREMEKTLQSLLKTKDDQLNRLKRIILGDNTAEFSKGQYVRDLGMNYSQNDALENIQNAMDLAIVHGPPGTGKTTTMVQAIMETLKVEKQVMVCAPSNAAVDLLSEKLGNQGISVLRIGHPARVTEDMLSKTMDAKIANHKDYKNLKDLRKRAEEYFSMAAKYKRSFGHNERAQRRAIKAEAHKLRDDAKQLEFYIANDVIAKSQIIACTLVGANNSLIKGMNFQTVFIDEAGQAMEPSCWIPILKTQRVIMAGDHCQLPPTIKSFEAAKQGLEVTLFERAIKNNNVDIMLREQYRMNEKIMNFSSRIFYKNELVANEYVKSWNIFEGDMIVEFIDTAGCGYFEDVDRETRSSFNSEESALLIRHLTGYIGQIDSMSKQDEISNIGIISPYKAQTNLLSESIIDAGLDEIWQKKINVNTVDSFQGQERDIIYISLVRSNENGEIGFLSDVRRMNVAMTRARKKLVVIGDSATIGQNNFYDQFLDYVNEIESYRSAFELME